jgi:hypothetical protein
MNLSRALSFCLTLCLLAAGCGDSRLVPVSGVVTLDGEPVAGVLVNFKPVPGKSADPEYSPTSFGRTDKKGRFRLESLDASGAAPGEHIVTIARQARNPFTEDGQVEIPEMEQPIEYILPEKARDGSLRFTVPVQGTDEANFDFQTK